MDKADVAHALGQIAALLELKGENPFRVRAYQAAARTVGAFPGDLRSAHASGALTEAKGLGPATLEIVDELLATGRSRMLDMLQDQVPPGLTDMLRISGLGVAKIRQIHESLHVESLAELEEAARDGRLARLPRFGARTAEKILRGIHLLRPAGGERLAHHARAEAEALAAQLRRLPGVHDALVAGSLRRWCEVVGDLDVVIVTERDVDGTHAVLRQLPGVVEIMRDTTGIGLRLEGDAAVTVHPAAPANLGYVLLRSTGSAAHLAQLAERARARGYGWEDRALVREGAPLRLPNEEAAYAALDLAWIPPELREGAGEIAAAEARTLPHLVERGDLVGFLHCHTGYSDGTNTVVEWADAGVAQGYRYLGISDHSPATAFGGGLRVEDVGVQHAEIDAANAARSDIHVLKGVEADILEDGTLDYPPEVRRRFEFVIGSVHTRYGMDRAAMTRRVLRAMDDPTMTILGHPTGRLLLSRPAFDLDLERVFRRAAERGVAIEINADPQRLDLDWRLLRQAVAAGVTISIGADAHGASQMHHVDLGVGIARKGWLTADQLLNVRPLDDFLAFARRRSG